MEEILSQAFSTGDIKIVVAAIILYVVIHIQRKETGKKRDTDREDLQTRIALLENEVNRLKDLDLESKLAQILTDLAWLKDRMK